MIAGCMSEVEEHPRAASLAIANQMILDALATLLSLSERLKDEARVESVVVWSLKILTVVSAATTTTLSALPGFNMGATIAGAVTVALTTIQSLEAIGVNRARKLAAARKLETVIISARMDWNGKLLRLTAADDDLDHLIEEAAADLVDELRRKSEDIAAFVEDLIVNVGNGRDAPEPETATEPETQQLGAQPSEAVV